VGAWPAFEQGIALLERASVTPPRRQEVWFHVEQPPIEELPPLFGAAGNQAMAAGFEGKDGEGSAQFGQAADRGTIELGLPVASGVPQSGPAHASALLAPFGEYFELGLTLLDES